jgi:hypothetical protein
MSYFMTRYRMYVDEVGNSDLAASNNPNHRYLSLTGIIVELGYVQKTVFPALEELKHRYFGSHPDEPVILHRKELVNKKYPFHALRDTNIEIQVNQELLALLTNLNRKYQVWRFDPYHYCLTVLVERYTRWLDRQDVYGDVMAESRGGREDRRLKDSFEGVFQNGTQYVEPELIHHRLTSRQLKVKAKSNNIAGLQLADIIAHPSYRATLLQHQQQAMPDNFGKLIAQILNDSKYDRSPQGRIYGWGQKWLP